MSIGNLKTDGGKGTNWPWQYKMLLGLDKIAAAIVTDGKDYESDLISIKCGADPAIIRLEVRIFNTTTGDFTNIELYPPGSLTEDTTDYSTCTKTYLDAGDATEATLQAILTKNGEIETTADAILAMNTDIEAKTTLVVANTDDIKGFNETIRDNTNSVTGVTPALSRVTTSGTIIEGSRSVSIANVGDESGTVLGTELGAGETVNFDAGSLNNTLAAVTYDPTTPGTGTTFLIATLT
jgi:uncharacterized protein (AIM24 family)